LTAKINLDAQVLNLLNFNAGISASIDRVSLDIQNVSARVTLEARIANLVTIVSDILDSIDLNPIIATLANAVDEVVNTTTTAVSTLTSRSYNLEHGILYSVNDYSGRTHKNRVITQTGSIIDEFLDNNGVVHSQNYVGSYLTLMRFNGYNQTVDFQGHMAKELEYVYAPFGGVSAVCSIFIDLTGSVVGTQLLSETNGGGASTVGD
jgi:hypothetical protein